MKTDLSVLIYEKYSAATDERVRIKFKDGHIEEGFLVGHFFGDEIFIHEWDFVPCEAGECSEFAIHQKIHQTIRQKDIAAIYFYFDNTVISTN